MNMYVMAKIKIYIHSFIHCTMCSYTTVYNVARQAYLTGFFFYHAVYLSITLVNFHKYIFNNTKKIHGAVVAR